MRQFTIAGAGAGDGFEALNGERMGLVRVVVEHERLRFVIVGLVFN